jgi:hypothetical protein
MTMTTPGVLDEVLDQDAVGQATSSAGASSPPPNW